MRVPDEDVYIVSGYLNAKRLVIEAGFGSDVDWAEDLSKVVPDTHYVMRETAWVIVNSGFRAKVARKLWPRLRFAFNEFVPQLIDDTNLDAALAVLNHRAKMQAIIDIAKIISKDGITQILEDAKNPPKLTRLPFIGKITCYHLAKVLGVDVVKPDVHLTRAAVAAKKSTPLALCEAIRNAIGDPLTVVDSVLWRYGEQREARKWAGWDELFATPAV